MKTCVGGWSRRAWLEGYRLHSILAAFVDDATSLVLVVDFWPTKTIAAHTCVLGKGASDHRRCLGTQANRLLPRSSELASQPCL